MTDRPAGPQALLALLPFLVNGALSLTVLRAMRARGLDVHIAFYLRGGGGYSPDPAEDWASEERLIDLHGKDRQSGLEILGETIVRRHIGLILQIGSPWAYPQLPYLKERHRDLIIVDLLYNKVGHTLNHFLYESCFDSVIVESYDMEQYILDNTNKPSPNVQRVESGIDLQRFRPPKSPRSESEGLVVGFLGRMSPEKNPLGFVALAERLHELLPTLRFRMFGEGEMTDAVKSRIATGTAGAAIFFGGYVEHQSDALAQIDVLVVPSKLDGRPNVIMEANACGIPVVGAPVGGIPELLEAGTNGFVLAPTDYERIAQILVGWTSDPASLHRIQATSRLFAEEHFDRERMLGAYETVFRRFAGDTGRDEVHHSASEPSRFVCNICGNRRSGWSVARGDGRRVVFCADCSMGVIENPPADTCAFYTDNYYGQTVSGEVGYQDYTFTAEHGLLWTRLFIEALKGGGKVLDVGCADGFLLRRLSGTFELFGIEANNAAAAQAAACGVKIIANDIADPVVTAGGFGPFDVIASMATFEHVLDLSAAFRTCLGLLKPDGVLLFELPLISDHRDNHDWFHSSYEHISYPTLTGMQRLFSLNSGFQFIGFESDIKGYGSTYIGAATRDAQTFDQLQRLMRAMSQQDIGNLDIVGTRLNLAYHVVHCFRPTPERVLALPVLLEVAATPNLLKRMTQLWYGDSVGAAAAQERKTM